MGFIFTGLFWGIILICFGILLIIKFVFNIKLPIPSIIISICIISIGVNILISSFRKKKCPEKAIVLQEKKTNSNSYNDEYNIIFGKGFIDLTGVEIDEKQTRMDVNTIFGSNTLKINQNIPTRIIIDTAFSSATTPDGNSSVFGTITYVTKSYQKDKTHLTIRASVVFGSLLITE